MSRYNRERATHDAWFHTTLNLGEFEMMQSVRVSGRGPWESWIERFTLRVSEMRTWASGHKAAITSVVNVSVPAKEHSLSPIATWRLVHDGVWKHA